VLCLRFSSFPLLWSHFLRMASLHNTVVAKTIPRRHNTNLNLVYSSTVYNEWWQRKRERRPSLLP
jgi:hypothetical protein